MLMMDIRIYQVNLDRDKNNVAFMGYDTLHRFQGVQKTNPEIYDRVFEGSVNCSGLEGVFAKFNTEHPEGYRGRSLSVSDIVEVMKAPGTEPGFYFCDSLGFKRVPFVPVQIPEKSNTIKVVLLEPGKVARIADIDASLKGLQEIVGGYIEAIYPYEDPVALVCNEEGKLTGLPLNRKIEDYDIIAGTFFICGLSEDSFASLTPDLMEKYKEKFAQPEQFMRLGKNILAFPMETSEEPMSPGQKNVPGKGER